MEVALIVSPNVRISSLFPTMRLEKCDSVTERPTTTQDLLVETVNFFFSRRRRHTSYIGDWSSDVCSSDLGGSPGLAAGSGTGGRRSSRAPASAAQRPGPGSHRWEPGPLPRESAKKAKLRNELAGKEKAQIGRASCRERGEISPGKGENSKTTKRNGREGEGADRKSGVQGGVDNVNIWNYSEK